MDRPQVRFAPLRHIEAREPARPVFDRSVCGSAGHPPFGGPALLRTLRFCCHLIAAACWLALDYRRQAAVCRIALGETDAAIPALESIIRAYEQVDAYSRGFLSLRLNLAQLRVSAGQQEQAADELWHLHDDAVRILGRGDELTAEIDEMRARLRRAV